MGTLNDLPMFFLSANSQGGYVSKFDIAYHAETGWKAFLLKGGKTVAKSMLLKRIASALQDRGATITLIPDLHDPKSLGGVIVEDAGVGFFDGDAPGYMPEKYPGVCERIVDFGRLIDGEKLKIFQPKIIQASQAADQLERRSRAYISAAAGLLADNRKIAAGCADAEKAEKFAASVADRLIPKGARRNESVRFLSGITPVGQVFYRSTVAKLCKDIYTISDEWGAVSGVIFEKIRQTALEKGQWVITCPCPLFPHDKIDHVLLPDAGIAFITANRYLDECDSVRRYHARRFTDPVAIRRHAQRMKFCKKAAADLIESGAGLLSGAAAERERMMGYYNAATDFDALPSLADQLLKEV